MYNGEKLRSRIASLSRIRPSSLRNRDEEPNNLDHA